MRAMMAKNPTDQKRQQMLNLRFPASDYQRFASSVHCESFVYQVNGVPVVGFLLKPKHQQGKLPVLVFNRGGNGGFGAWKFGNIFYDLMPLAEQGYLVLASNYRGEIQPGGQQHVADEFGGADVADVLAFKQLIPTIAAADANKVAMIGHSRGGMQSWLAAKNWPELKALMILAGVSDLQQELKVRPEMEKVYTHRIPDYHNNKEQQLKARSVVHFLPQIRADLPVLILHGDADKQVTVQSAYQIEALLKARNQPHKMVIYPRGDHGFTQYRTEIKQEILQFYPPAAKSGS
jgi:dipeptidyl aminopeptidase/acylaminoacyl peptidase